MSESEEFNEEDWEQLLLEFERSGHPIPAIYHARLRKNSLFRFTQRLMARQGTRLPDFDALYKYKAELDKRLTPPEPPKPQS